MAAVAIANGLNANMLRRWVKEAGECAPSSAHKDTAAVTPAFVQLPLPQDVQSAPPPPPPASASAQAPDAYFSPSWTPFQADGGRDFSVIVDGVSV